MDITNDKRKQRVYAIMYLKRMFSLRQMDLDYSLSQMIQLCLSPTKVYVIVFFCLIYRYKMTAWRKRNNSKYRLSHRNKKSMGS